MRFTINMQMSKAGTIPYDYRSNVVSLLKYSLQKVNSDFYTKLYENGNQQKWYTWSLYVPKGTFGPNEIRLNEDEPRLILNFSCLDQQMAMNVYNAFKWLSGSVIRTPHRFSGDILIKHLTIKKYYLTPIKTTQIVVKTLSPIAVRDHRAKNDDWYYSVNDLNHFTQILKRNMTTKYEPYLGSLTQQMVNQFQILPIQPKMTVVKCYNKQLECSTGIYVLQGSQELLELIRDGGLGSQTGLGFGLLQIV
ncbi:CRISPR-associated endoribonuclease Cas6 [Lactobacillus selangorensis]|nr:CRISPR-associated endoribonuclease Cas6 [Lactobacillus selangorensis]